MRDRYTDSGRWDEQWDNKMRSFENTVGRWPTPAVRLPTGLGSAATAESRPTDEQGGFWSKVRSAAAITATAAAVAAAVGIGVMAMQANDPQEDSDARKE
jgi:hypothetical protein